MNKRILLLFTALLLLLLPALPANAATDITEENGYRIVIEDDADLLTAAEEQELLEVMRPVTEYANVAFHTVSASATHSSTETYAAQYYMSTFGNHTNGTIFLIDMHKRNIWIVSDGAAYSAITTAKANTITDNIYTYASDKEYYRCAAEAFRQMYMVLNGEKIAEPMKYAGNALLAVAIALLFTFILVQRLTAVRKPTNREWLAASHATFLGGTPRSIHTGQTRRYDPPSSSSGGGGGGHGGGGGGFSGGGGGHGF